MGQGPAQLGKAAALAISQWAASPVPPTPALSLLLQPDKATPGSLAVRGWGGGVREEGAAALPQEMPAPSGPRSLGPGWREGRRALTGCTGSRHASR